MLTKVWRYSHFGLTLVSSIFLLLATLTGFILAFEPIQKQLQPYQVSGAKALPLATFLATLSEQYEEVLEIEVDANGFVKIDVINMEEELNGSFYINPFNGKRIANIPPKNAFFEWFTNFHRSLFLKSTGRILVGIISFFLFLIAITGTLLLIKRQGGIRAFFAKTIKDDFYQYYHIILGRWTLIPIIIISLTGAYLSLLRFELLPNGKAVVIENNLAKTITLKKAIKDFDLFKQIRLGDLKKLEFPFSKDADDYFILNLVDRQLKINQFTGQVVETLQYPTIQAISRLSFNLHTGTGSIIWSLILAITAVNILFFMFSGSILAYRRLRSNIRNSISPSEAEYIILVGSENGSTKNFGKALQQALLRLNKKVFLDELNNYQVFQKMKNLVVLTSTYGEGDPPSNATNFLQKLKETPPLQRVNYSVVGFGSLAYLNFCEYAKLVDKALAVDSNLAQVTKAHLIHNQSETSFKTWLATWGKEMGLRLELSPIKQKKSGKLLSFKVVERALVNDGYGETFTLTLTSTKSNFQSGDLLGIIPPNDTIERWYSIAEIQKNSILLSIKRHELGLCSNYLYHLPKGATVQARLKKNKDFHFPKKAKNVILIANGTGIAPFLGMFQNVPTNTNILLYWGGKTPKYYQLYQKWIEAAIENKVLQQCKIAYSRAESPYNYVQDIIREEREILAKKLNNGATIMICGAIALQNDVLAILEETTMEFYQQKLSVYLQNGQILMDCY